MTLGLLFYILMLLWLFFGLLANWPGRTVFGPYGGVVNSLLLFVLFLILGWHAFGAPVHG